MAQQEWAEIYDWQTLYTQYRTNTSTSTGNASVGLPSDFRKLASFPHIAYESGSEALFTEIKPQDRGQYAATDKRVEVTGNPGDGYTMFIAGVTLASGASIMVPYFRSPTSLASPADISMVPNHDFLIKRVVAQIWEAREDARFQQAKAEADLILRNMIEFENVFSQASDDNRVKSIEETRYDFRLGED